MVSARETHRHGVVCRIISTVLTVVFTFGVIYPPYIAEAQVMPMLPLPGTMVIPTNGYMPTMIKGIEVHPENPLEFNFIIDTGDTNLTGQALHDESIRLIKYFLASLTVPADQLWVNLSPYEGDRIIPDRFGATEMGRDLLAQDYILKQLTASLMYPEQELGKKFWDRVYERAQKEFGTTDIAMDSFHKVWIVPDQADVFQKGNHAFVMRSHLKVMLEEDYFAMRETLGAPEPQSTSAPERVLTGEPGNGGAGELTKLQTEIMREVIIPEIEKEVNEGQSFSQLRQIFHAMILAIWFKQNLKESLLGKIYVDQNKIKGVDTDPAHKQKIYEQYVQAFEKGVYNYIKEEVDPVSKEIVPRNYFSGGTAPGRDIERIIKTVNGTDGAMLARDFKDAQAAVTPDGTTVDMGVNLLEDRDPQHLAAALPKITVPGGFDVTVTGVSEKNGRKVYTLSWAVSGMANKIEPVKGVEFSFNGSAEEALEAVRARMDSIQRSGSRVLDSVWDVSPLNRHLANFSAEDLTEFWKNQVAVIQDRVLDPISKEQSDSAMLATADIRTRAGDLLKEVSVFGHLSVREIIAAESVWEEKVSDVRTQIDAMKSDLFAIQRQGRKGKASGLTMTPGENQEIAYTMVMAERSLVREIARMGEWESERSDRQISDFRSALMALSRELLSMMDEAEKVGLMIEKEKNRASDADMSGERKVRVPTKNGRTVTATLKYENLNDEKLVAQVSVGKKNIGILPRQFIDYDQAPLDAEVAEEVRKMLSDTAMLVVKDSQDLYDNYVLPYFTELAATGMRVPFQMSLLEDEIGLHLFVVNATGSEFVSSSTTGVHVGTTQKFVNEKLVPFLQEKFSGVTVEVSEPARDENLNYSFNVTLIFPKSDPAMLASEVLFIDNMTQVVTRYATATSGSALDQKTDTFLSVLVWDLIDLGRVSAETLKRGEALLAKEGDLVSELRPIIDYVKGMKTNLSWPGRLAMAELKHQFEPENKALTNLLERMRIAIPDSAMLASATAVQLERKVAGTQELMDFQRRYLSILEKRKEQLRAGGEAEADMKELAVVETKIAATQKLISELGEKLPALQRQSDEARANAGVIETIGIAVHRLAKLAKKIVFGTSGNRRGIKDRFHEENAPRDAYAVAMYMTEMEPDGTVLISFDPRKGNADSAKRSAQILAAFGIKSIFINEPTPTPVLAYLAQSSKEIRGVINYTASHNPAEDDGFKFSPYHGGAAPKSTTDRLEDYANNIDAIQVMDYEAAVAQGLIVEMSGDEAVQKYVHDYIIPRMKKLGARDAQGTGSAWNDIVAYFKADPERRLIEDPMQGTMVKYAKAVLEALAKDVG
ncbi:MAG TPA: hypothetical protein VLJ10_05365, partial [Candidatus Bathyarchaeia archaeon]|nr:hypothetical protein [Candidatus Bathyarchaeia archaeon]